jgi:hypothetical protein
MGQLQQRAEIATPLGMAFAAALTFTTVVWRGLVGEFQAREQKRANDQKDEENIARLLLDGAKLLGDTRPSHLAAGIAVLSQAISLGKTNHAKASMDIIADFIKESLKIPANFELLDSAVHALNYGSKLGYCANRSITVETQDGELIAWWINGMQSCTYEGGVIGYHLFDRQADIQQFAFNRVTFHSSPFADEPTAENCNFRGCSFKEIDIAIVWVNEFYKCDFSNAQVSKFMFEILYGSYDSAMLRKKVSTCHYYRDSPPTGNGADLILPYLIARDRATT